MEANSSPVSDRWQDPADDRPLQMADPVRLRRGLGMVLAIEWNLPLLFLFWFPWSVFHLVLIGHCFVWALGCYLCGRSLWFRSLLFRPAAKGSAPRGQAAAVMMVIWGVAALVAWFLAPR